MIVLGLSDDTFYRDRKAYVMLVCVLPSMMRNLQQNSWNYRLGCAKSWHSLLIVAKWENELASYYIVYTVSPQIVYIFVQNSFHTIWNPTVLENYLSVTDLNQSSKMSLKRI